MVRNNKRINLVLLLTGGYGFPVGDAYTNRVLAFAKGFVKNGCKVTILILYPGHNNQAPDSGDRDGFAYRFCAGTKRHKNFLLRKITGMRGIINAVRILIGLNKTEKIDCVISFTQRFTQNFPIYIFTRFHKIMMLRENNEFPVVVLRRGHNRLSPLEAIYFRLVNRFYDGYIYISSALVNFNKKLLPPKIPIIIVPIIVDSERFDFPRTIPEKWITYCGELFGDKDGVEILIKAFALIQERHYEYKLMLIGDTSNYTEYRNLKSLISRLGIESKVEFTGFVHRDEIPGLLHNSSALMLARPDNIQAKGGFPTKLGEYLATGRPVLITAVSDISQYIKHGLNGFLATPGSVNDFADKLDWILTNYPVAAEAGIEGQKLTESDFSNRYQASRIMKFIEDLK
jgi:glycosyltransferase involved in cell wall biosynthesis